MRMRYKSALMFIFILILGCLALRVSYAFYEVITTDSVIIVDGKITINYLNGQEFKYVDNSTLKFSVTNNGSEQAFYYIELEDVQSDNVVYELKNSSNDLEIKNELSSSTLSSYISIDANQTQNYELNIRNNGKKEYSGKLKVGIEANNTDMFTETILKNNEVLESPITGLDEVAINKEGLIKSIDDQGVSYYYRGAIDNNYVSFAGFTWRIVKINGDGSVKLVMNNVIDTLSAYYTEGYEYEGSLIYENLNMWYESTLKDYADIIANYKFCNDAVVEESENGYYAAYNRISVNYIPNNYCLGTQVSGKVGLLTADEVALAGGASTSNTSYYLYNSEITTDYYTMTSAKISGIEYYPYSVKVDGTLNSDTEGKLLRGIRPVINIIKNVSVTGSGMIDDPYIINIEE